MAGESLWFDIDGNPVSPREAGEILADTQGRRIGWTIVGDWRVSTVHLVLNHRFFEDRHSPPLIFETMVFGPEGVELPDDVPECVRTPTKHAALAAHDQVVAALRKALT